MRLKEQRRHFDPGGAEEGFTRPGADPVALASRLSVPTTRTKSDSFPEASVIPNGTGRCSGRCSAPFLPPPQFHRSILDA